MPRIAVGLILLAAMAAAARADEKKFAYAYEAKTLPEGTIEFEQWLTLRNAKAEGQYRLFQMRSEVEYGFKDRLTTSLYLNYDVESIKDVPGLEDEHKTKFESVSNEWKYKLSDPSADPVGILLYGEAALGSDVRELELKLIANKRVGPLNLVYNLVLEFAQESEEEPSGEEEWEKDSEIQHLVGLSYEASPNLAFGVEGLSQSGFAGSYTFKERDSLAYYAGPNVSATFGRWWATFTVLWQADLSADHGLDLEGHEKYQVRLIVGITL